MSDLKQSDDNKFIPMTSVSAGKGREITPDVFYYTNQIVNVIFLGRPGEDNWVLVDCGMPKSGEKLIAVAEERFGRGTKPSAIILTHGHFDHVGSVVHLIEQWNVDVYAHPMEFPYLTGALAYPEPDTSVEGGMLAKISSVYPNEPINITEVLKRIPNDHSLPGLPGWNWIHTPGHSPGQIALFREADRVLISADAVITVKQDSMYKVLTQKEEICGPPVYLTTDWTAARDSVQHLADLKPEYMIPGHGTAMQGEELRQGLDNLVANFDELAIPEHGKWV